MCRMVLTSYMTSVQPSRVTHWNTVSMARPKLSKLMMPLFGPSQNSSQIRPSSAGHWNPLPSTPHGCGSSTIVSKNIYQIFTICQFTKLIHIITTWIFKAGKCTTSSFLVWYRNRQKIVKTHTISFFLIPLLYLSLYQTRKLEVVHFQL